MMSKNSFWVRLKQNAKRRNWCYFINLIVLILAMPVTLLVGMSGVDSRYYPDAGERAENLYRTAFGQFGTNVVMAVIVIVLAMIAAVQGFSYLYSRKKVDMYHSQPVSNRLRFGVIYANSVLSFVAPYLIALFLAFLVAVPYGVVNAQMVEVMGISVVLYLCLYISVYSVVALAVMLTGKLLTGILGSAVFLFYGAAFGLALRLYQNHFYYTSVFTGSEIIGHFFTRFSVVGVLMKFGNLEGVIVARKFELGQLCPGIALLAGELVLAAVLFTVINYLLFVKRKAESAGAAMAFGRTKAVIEVFVSVPVALLGGYVIGSMGYKNVFFVLGCILTVIILHIVIQLIYEGELSAVFRKWAPLAISAVCSILIFANYYFDLTGYDHYVPKESQIESAAYRFNYNTYLNLDGDRHDWYYIDREKYLLDEMNYTDTAVIVALAQNNVYADLRKVGEREDMYEEEQSGYLYGTVCYKLKNGKTETRRIALGETENYDMLEKLISSEEFKKAYFQIYDERMTIASGKFDWRASIDDGMEIYDVPTELYDGLREAYLSDLDAFTYGMGAHGSAVAEFKICQYKDSDYPNYTCYIYPEFEQTLNYLSENGIYVSIVLEAEEALKELVTEIEITTYDREDYSVRETATYTDKGQIAEILENVDLLLGYGDFTTNTPKFYSIRINDNQETGYYLKDGAQFPEFVLKDLGQTP